MAKLWDKGVPLNKLIEQYTAGEDYILDQRLVEYDALASIAHAQMLRQIRILTGKEFDDIKKQLVKIIKLNRKRMFILTEKDEDVHTKIENYLTRKLGKTGGKIHAGRSRNDQVLADLRLYSKEKLFDVKKAALNFSSALLEFSRRNENVPMPGYTHVQRAMPSSVALWSSSFIWSSLDDLVMLDAACRLNDQCPLGSGAGYGVPLTEKGALNSGLKIRRMVVSGALGFEKVQQNVLYVQNSRGKIEAAILAALSQVYLGLAAFANDLLLFTTKEFGFFSLPDEFCTGSSMMPNKKNYDVLELLRGRSNKMQEYLDTAYSIRASLTSGYSRDLQETKEPLMKGFDLVLSTLKVCTLVAENLKVNKKRLKMASSDPALYATDKAYMLVEQKGIPFRDAYRQVAKNIGKLKAKDPVKAMKERELTGAAPSLKLDHLEESIAEQYARLDGEKGKFNKAIQGLYLL